jgi:hypothetical protein
VSLAFPTIPEGWSFQGYAPPSLAHPESPTFAFPSLMSIAQSIAVRIVIAKDLARGVEAGTLLA